MHITSLPSRYGIGTMGEEAYKFVDFLEKAGQKAWQVLPIGHTSFGDSPYQSYSSYAGNPYLIDLDVLIKEGLLKKSEIEGIFWGKDETRVDYGALYAGRFEPLKKAAGRLLENPPLDYYTFLEENLLWLDDYAAFMAIKEQNGGRGRDDWKRDLRYKNEMSRFAASSVEAALYKAIQYLFFKQWFKLKEYANEKGIEIIGDMPIYCASDSADVWAEPEVFELDGEYLPSRVAGCPPDAFSPLGQRWGNPLYDWKALEGRGYDWWERRIAFALKIFDTVRIDHFRGFDSYFAIDRRYETAVNGEWVEGPKTKIFDALKDTLGDNLPVIAEDLGYLTDSVRKLLDYTGYPGMKVLEFAFDSREGGEYLPHNYPQNCVCYIGTHDNDTAEGWYKEVDKQDREMARRYFNLTEEEGIACGLMHGAMASNSFLTIFQMQDVLGLGSESRMNTPSTSCGNWQWRMEKGAASERIAEKLKDMTRLFGR
ncbi:MAG: 4-alpha-glucanotransferase [Clostridia bacterium]|nr:4-alpha-glucanotransferase [Clostridia bacterium]